MKIMINAFKSNQTNYQAFLRQLPQQWMRRYVLRKFEMIVVNEMKGNNEIKVI